MTEYNILLQAKINPTNNIQSSLNTLSKSISLTISNIKVDPTALNNITSQINAAINKGLTGTGNSGGGSSGGSSGGGSSGGKGGSSSNGKYVMSAAELARINTAAGNLNTKLQTLKATNADAFKVPGIQDQYNHMMDLNGALLKGKTGLANVNYEQKLFEGNLKKANDGLRTTTTSTDNFASSIGKAIGKIALWGVATGLLYGSLKKIQEGVQYIKDLNQEMTNIGVVTGQTTSELSGMAQQFNQTAKEYGVTTLSVAEGSLEFIRQGKTVAETNELIRVSMMTSKLANMESAEATEYLTAIMAGFKLEASDMIGVLDKLTVVDNNSATSVAELAEGMKRSANSAQQVGVSLEELISYVGTVSSVTRKSSMLCQVFNP